MSARLDPDVFAILSTNLAKLESRSHFAIKLVLLLSNLNMVLRGGLHCPAEVGVYAAAVWEKIAEKAVSVWMTSVTYRSPLLVILTISFRVSNKAFTNDSQCVLNDTTPTQAPAYFNCESCHFLWISQHWLFIVHFTNDWNLLTKSLFWINQQSIFYTWWSLP